ncbi:MAG: ferric reductase-like transmembrane domain-containing protein [Candidatus Micrarchaeia archaeon]
MQKTSWLMFIIVCALALLGAYQALIDQSAQRAVIRYMALSGFFLLCMTLIIGPLAVLFPQRFDAWVEPRRAVGLAAFVFIVLHLSLVMSLYFGWNFARVIANTGLAVATPAVIILFALTATSSDWAIKKIGFGKWKIIQEFNYAVFILVFAHFLIKASGPSVLPAGFPKWDWAELAMIGFGVATVVLQIAGFYARISRKKEPAPQA